MIKVEETQRQHAAAILDVADQLAPRAILDVRFHHVALDQDRLARRRLAERVEPRLVVVAQRQVQDEIEFAVDAQLGKPIQRAPAEASKRGLRIVN